MQLYAMKYLAPKYYLHSFQNKKSNSPRSWKILLTLLFIDFLFILIHAYSLSLPLNENTQNLRLDMDFGYAEIFQYVKYICAAILLVGAFFHSKIGVYLTWAMFFIFLFVDDAFAFHEIFGEKFVRYFNISGFAGLRAQDIGELAMAAFLGLLFVLPFFYSFFKGSEKSKEVTTHFVLLVGILLFFGIGIDMVHSFMKAIPGSGVLTVIEDAGEMLAVSLLVWYSLYLYLEKNNDVHQ